MDTSDSNKLHILEADNELKKIEAYHNDRRVLECSSEVVYKGLEEIKALLEEIKLYTEEKCELEKVYPSVQDECKIKQTQNLNKMLDENMKKYGELQILYQQKRQKKFELKKKYEVMMKEKSQRLRDLHMYYNKEYCVKELAMMKEKCEELSKKKQQALNVIDELQRESDEMRPSVPGKKANGKKLKGKNRQKNKTSKK